MLPLEVLEEAQRDFLDYNNTGMSITEMSHRTAAFDEVHNECISLFRELLNISDDYYVLLVQGGASTQFEAVPLNLLHNKADYLVTGNFAKKAYKEAIKYGDVAVAASSEASNFTYIPKMDEIKFRDGLDYVHYTSNNTIYGTRYTFVPEVDAPLVCDMSSNILSETIDVNKFGVIYAGAQKNIAPAGVTVVIARKDLVEHPQTICPTMMKWKTQADKNSLYNTPPCFSIYMAMLNLRYLKKNGGVAAIQKVNEYKAGLLYDFIDNSSLYKNTVNAEDRSLMNVTFVTGSDEMNKKFVAEAAQNGIVSIKGHRLVGGMRASIYNSMPVEGVKHLIDFMKKFELENK